MNRSSDHRRGSINHHGRGTPRADSPSEMQAANLGSPFFREIWSISSEMTWQQFIARWESRFHSAKPPRRRGR
jgi:hypothetical protein